MSADAVVLARMIVAFITGVLLAPLVVASLSKAHRYVTGITSEEDTDDS